MFQQNKQLSRDGKPYHNRHHFLIETRGGLIGSAREYWARSASTTSAMHDKRESFESEEAGRERAGSVAPNSFALLADNMWPVAESASDATGAHAARPAQRRARLRSPSCSRIGS